MTHTIQLVHGSTTLDISAGDYGVLEYSPRTGNINQDTVQDKIVVYVTGSDADDLQSNLQALIHAFEIASRRNTIRTGDRLWLHLTPNGYDDAYRTEILDGTVDLPDDALQGRWANLAIDVTVNFTRKNFWEDTSDTLLSVSNDIPVTWTERQPAGDSNKAWAAVASDDDGTNLIAGVGGAFGGRLYTSANSGTSWTERQPAGATDKIWVSVDSDNDGSNLIAAVSAGRLWLSDDSGATWSETRPAGDASKAWQGVASDSDGSNLIACVISGRIYISDDSGSTWSETRPDGDADFDWQCVASNSDGSFLMAAEVSGRIYISSDSGTTWSEVRPLGDVNGEWYSVACDSDGSHLIAGESGGRLYTSDDSGDNWTERQPAGDSNESWYSVTSDNDGSNLAAVNMSGRVYTSMDYGVTWAETQPAGDADKAWTCITSDSDGTNLIAGVGVAGGRLYTTANAFPPVVSLSNDGTTYNNWLEYAAQTGFDLPSPVELHLSTLTGILSRFYVGAYDCQNLMTDFDHYFEVNNFTTTDGTETVDATCSDGNKMAFSLDSDTVQSAYTAFQSTITKLNNVQGKRLRPFLRWADTTDIANVQVRLRLTINTTNIYVTNWVTPATYLIQEMPILAVPRISSDVTGTFDPQVRLYVDVKRTTASTEDVAIDFITLLPSDNMTVLDQGAALTCDPDGTAYLLYDLPYDENAESLLYSGTDFYGTWVRLGKNPVMIYPNQAGTLVFCWRDDDGTNSGIDENISLVYVSYRKRRLSL